MSGEKDTERRILWRANNLGIEDEPLIVSLAKYRQNKNRQPVDPTRFDGFANLISSRT